MDNLLPGRGLIAVEGGLSAAAGLALGRVTSETRYNVVNMRGGEKRCTECFKLLPYDMPYCKRHPFAQFTHTGGLVVWEENFKNLVVDAGLMKLLDATLKTGLTTPLWYVGLKGTGTVVAGDIMSSHGGWTTITPYSNANDPVFTPGTISTPLVDNSASKAVFNINNTADVYGCFLKDLITKGGATGTLYGAGDFGTMRSVLSGDTLNVTVSVSLTAV